MNSVTAEAPETYYRRELDVASNSGLVILDSKSPAHYKHWCENPDQDKDSPALRFGKAFHCAVLEPDVFEATYTVLPAEAPARPTSRQWAAKKPSPESIVAMEWWTAFNERNAGRELLSPADYEKCRRMAESVHGHSLAVAGLLTGGERELTFRWVDDDSGVHCKARADLYASGMYMLDLKTTRDASHEAFARAIAGYRYDQQAAHYCTAARVCDKPVPHYIILACESEPPYVCQPYFLDPVAEERGFNLRNRSLRKLAQCIETNSWPGYSTKFEPISLPTWAFYGIEDTK